MATTIWARTDKELEELLNFYLLSFLHKKDQTSDKVWGYFTLYDGSTYNFWGKRGKQLSFKRWQGKITKYKSGTDCGAVIYVDYKLENKEMAKIKEGYRKISDPNSVWPNFLEVVKDELFAAKFSNTVRSNEDHGTPFF